MAKIKKLTEQGDARPADRRDPYTPPMLKEFGPVGALTQGGSIGQMEESGPQPMKN